MNYLNKKIQILMSTYNGEKYLREQLESILAQDYVNISILIRDDGSVDNTGVIIEEYVKKYPNIEYYKGNNIGVISSFFDLIMKADNNCDYFAFSDQDDVWLKNKLRRAISILNEKKNDRPLLYCSKPKLVNYELSSLKSTIRSSKIEPSFMNAVIENICTGCTSLMNLVLLNKIKENIPQYTVMHDWWIYLIASYFGDVYYDCESFVLYRQHSQNVIGSRNNYIDEFKSRCKNYKENRGKISKQLDEFIRLYGDRVYHDQIYLKYIHEYKRNLRYRLKIVFSSEIYRQRRFDNIIFKILFLFGKV